MAIRTHPRMPGQAHSVTERVSSPGAAPPGALSQLKLLMLCPPESKRKPQYLKPRDDVTGGAVPTVTPTPAKHRWEEQQVPLLSQPPRNAGSSTGLRTHPDLVQATPRKNGLCLQEEGDRWHKRFFSFHKQQFLSHY